VDFSLSTDQLRDLAQARNLFSFGEYKIIPKKIIN
jgi:hypothetical protein